jgi:hypothetical protein
LTKTQSGGGIFIDKPEDKNLVSQVTEAPFNISYEIGDIQRISEGEDAALQTIHYSSGSGKENHFGKSFCN